MKTVQKGNRIEQINDTDLPVFEKRGWREVDAATGAPATQQKGTDTAVQVTNLTRMLAASESERDNLAKQLAAAVEELEKLKAKQSGKSKSKQAEPEPETTLPEA